jgi:hypothetical protein
MQEVYYSTMKLPRLALRSAHRLMLPAVAVLACVAWKLPLLLHDSASETDAGSATPAASTLDGPSRNVLPADGALRTRKLCDLGDQRINESSGVGASRRYPNYLWTHNDSGDEARLFLVTPQGKTVTVVNLDGARNQDWEDMAVAGTGRHAWVYVGDIGDNLKARANIVVYRFREPQISLSNAPQTTTVPWERMTLEYPDDAHDAEALLATADGHLVIATKDFNESLIFMTPRPFAPGTTQKLVRVGAHTFADEVGFGRVVTGGDLRPDGKRLVLRTYTRAYEWTLSASSGRQFATAWKTVWKMAPRALALPATKQGEAICYSPNGKRLFTTSEGLPTPLYELTP